MFRLPFHLLALLVLAACATSTAAESAADVVRRLAAAAATNGDDGVRAVLDAAGATPIRRGGELVFVAQAVADDAPRIVGDFNDGGYDATGIVGDGSMRRLEGSSWYVRRLAVPTDARFEYLVRHGDSAAPDPANPSRVTTFGTERSVAVGPDTRQPPTPPVGVTHGRIETFRLRSEVRDNERDVAIYRPPIVAGDVPLPTLYVKDGTRFREAGDMAAVLDALIATRAIPPVVVVFVDPVGRGLEYGTFDGYRRFVVDELVPEVERRVPNAGGEPRLRGVFGASRGGLAAADLVLREPGTFGFAACMSPALRPLPLVDEILASTRVSGRFVVLVSRYDTPAVVADGRALADALDGRADRVDAVDMPIDHSIHGWKAWLDVVLVAWLDGLPNP